MENVILSILLSWAVFIARSAAYSVTASNDANTLANAIFNGPGIAIVSASYTGAAAAAGTFADGPFGIGTGAILTTGTAVGSLPNGDHYVNNGQPGSSTYCGPNTFNAAILSVDILVGVGYNGVLVEFIMASEEEGGSSDPLGIFLDSTNYATDPDGNPFTATSPYLAQPIVIVPPNSVTSYPGSSPPIDLIIPASTGAHTVVFAICDKGDSEWDSAMLIRAQGSVETSQAPEIDYVTSTITVVPPAQTSTETIKASGTVSGTFKVSVYASTTSTTESSTTTTEESTTTTTTSEESTTTTTTTTEESTTTTITTEESTTTTTTSSEESRTTTTTTSTTRSLTTSSTTSTSSSTTSSLTSSRTSSSSSSRTTTFPSLIVTSNSTVTRTPQDSSTEAETTAETTELASSTEDPIASTTDGTATSSATAAASNLPRILGYKYTGCVGSPEGYPDFTELQSDEEMTTERCIELANGSKYAGLHESKCYIGDTLEEVAFLANANCDIPCPGDPGLFCGGDIENPASLEGLLVRGFGLKSRAISPNILLTLYELIEDESVSTTEAATTEATTEAATEATTEATTAQASAPEEIITTAVPVSTISSDGEAISTLYETETLTEPSDGRLVTRTITTTLSVQTTVTGVSYTTVDLNGFLIVAGLSLTIEYHPCDCVNNGLPEIQMTTAEAQCRACGPYGEDLVTLTVPKTGTCVPEPTNGGYSPLEPWVQYDADSYPDGNHPSLPIQTKVYGLPSGDTQPGVPGDGEDTSKKGKLQTVRPVPPSGSGSGSPQAPEEGGEGKQGIETQIYGPPQNPTGAQGNATSGKGATEAPGVVPTSPVVVARGTKRSMDEFILLMTLAIVLTVML